MKWVEALRVTSSITLSAIFVGALSFASIAGATAAVEVELREAEKLATEGEAREAIEAYGDLVQKGVDTAELRFNLGTLYLESGDSARAIYHLKTAVLRDPLLGDARYNLSVATTLRADSVSDATTSGVTIAAIGRRVPKGMAAVLAGLLFAFFGVGMGLRLFVLGKLRLGFTTFAIVCGALSLFAFGLLAARLHAETVVEAVVIVDETRALLGPSDDAKESFIAHAGLFGAVVDESNGYIRLRLANGLEAWVVKGALAIVDGKRRLP